MSQESMYPPMKITVYAALTRRKAILKMIVPALSKNTNLTEDYVRSQLPRLVSSAEKKFVYYFLTFEESDTRRHLGLRGCLSQDNVAWQVDATLWQYAHEGSCLSGEEIEGEFVEAFPEPDRIAYPFDTWLPLVTGQTKATKAPLPAV